MSRTSKRTRVLIGGSVIAAALALTACNPSTGTDTATSDDKKKTTASAKTASDKDKAPKYELDAGFKTLTTTPGTPVTVAFEDQDVLTEKEVGPKGYRYMADQDEPYDLVEVGQPDHGTISRDGKKITYTPEAGFTGEDHFDYTIEWRGMSDSGKGTVIISEPTSSDTDGTGSGGGGSYSGGDDDDHVSACIGKRIRVCT